MANLRAHVELGARLVSTQTGPFLANIIMSSLRYFLQAVPGIGKSFGRQVNIEGITVWNGHAGS